jgi:predicted RNA binding protein YcfA (HicA-like mRNA interferase family)
MTRCEKLLQKARNNPKGVRYGDLVKLAECFGFVYDHHTGSHAIYKQPKHRRQLTLQPDQNGMAKTYQVRQALKEIAVIQEAERNSP